ncbi:MAG: AAA family ATPase [Rhodobacter sp.]|nr:AAA family ATPase [Rhodobacter sp.]
MDGTSFSSTAQDAGRAKGPSVVFCTGFGQFDTHSADVRGPDGKPRRNAHLSAGQPYQTITPKAVVALVENPPSVDKAVAQWIIPSTYAESDARAHSVQRERGNFWLLPLDVDNGNLSLDEVDQALVAVCGQVNRAIYSTKSAQLDNRKWRAFMALSAPIRGEDYSDTLRAFIDLLSEATSGRLVADQALCRPGQLVYLPNRGDFYERRIDLGRQPLVLSAGHAIIDCRERNRAERAELERRVAEEQAVRKALRAAEGPNSHASVIEAFNEAHEIADLLVEYGYEPECEMGGRDWRSPYQTSGSFATRDYGTHWISLSGSDAAQNLGKQTASGVRSGDAFDLYVRFAHRGDFRSAVRAYAADTGRDHVTLRKSADPADYFDPIITSEVQQPAPVSERRPRLLPVLDFVAAADTALTESARPLVKGMLDEGAFSVFYGPSNSGKTFVVLDLAYSIALGRDWAGMKTTKAAVLYIAAEGGGGIKKRIAALRQRPGAADPEAFYLSAGSIDLRRPDGEVAAVIETVRSLGGVGLIVIDTLSRALAGGDETKDMGALVVNIDKIRQATGAHVLLVHHSGKDVAKGARGSSELRGAIDTEINIDGGAIRVTKQRDLEFGEDISFEIQGAPIGLDADGDVVTSATVCLHGSQRGKPGAPTAKETEVLDVVRDLLAEGGGGATVTANTVAQHYDGAGERMSPDTARKHLQSLADKRELRSAGRGRWALAFGKTPEKGPKSGNSELPKSEYAIPAYTSSQHHPEDYSERGVFS